LIDLILLAQAQVQPTVPDTVTWSWTGTAIIVGACLLCLLIIPRTIRYPHVGNKMPLPFPAVFNNPSVGSFLASMSAGHILGIGTALSLNVLGILK
jgi:photosystem I subunit 10